MRLIPLCLLGVLIACAPSSWALECARIFQSDMVLPQGKKLPVWGKAKAGAMVEVKFKGQKLSTKANEAGEWKVVLAPLKVDTQGAVLTVQEGAEIIKMENILVGEVWLASGQSNMQWRMNQSANQNEIPNKENSQIRIMNLTSTLHTNPGAYNIDDYRKKCEANMFAGEWKRSEAGNIKGSSAVGYLFAKELQKKLNVPVGLICNAVGGVGMEAWTSASFLEKSPSLKSLTGRDWMDSQQMSPWAIGRAKENLRSVIEAGEEKLRHPFVPSCLYEEGLEWMLPFPVSGVIWYQGETNAELEDKKLNTELMKAFISSWREGFRNETLPFIMVQLPRINDGSRLRAKWPEFREVQEEVADTVPGVAAVCTIDLGSTNSNVHPPDKKDVAERVANVALNRVYHKSAPESSRVTKLNAKGDSIYLLTNAKSLKTTDGKEARCFEISEDGENFVPATAKLKKNVIVLTSPLLTSPQMARYAWATYVEPNVVNDYGLPLFPYRSVKGAAPASALGVFPKGRKVKVACIGDSITAGYGIRDVAARYPQVLETMLGEKFEVKNFGNSGKTAGDYPSQKYRKQWYAYNKEYQEAIDYQADIYICNLGINDTGSWWEPDKFREGYLTIIQAMKGERNPTFVMWGKLGPDYRGEPGKEAFPGNVFDEYKFGGKDNLSSVNRPAAEKIIAELAKQEKCYLIDAYTPVSKTPEYYAKDGLHPDARGAKVIATFTYEWLAKHYKLGKKTSFRKK